MYLALCWLPSSERGCDLCLCICPVSVCLMAEVLWVNKHSADAGGDQAWTFPVESKQMASRLTSAAEGGRGRLLERGEGVIKGPVLQTQPLDTSNRVPGGPWPPAQLHQQQWPVWNLVELIKRDTMVFYHAWRASNTTPLHSGSPSTSSTSQFGTVNTLTLQPFAPCINLQECL